MAVGQAPESSSKAMPWDMQETFRLIKKMHLYKIKDFV